MAQTLCPQLASAPNMAAFTREEPITLLASRSAISSLRAPETVQEMSRLAPRRRRPSAGPGWCTAPSERPQRRRKPAPSTRSGDFGHGVGQHHAHVVGGGVPVDGDAVEGALHHLCGGLLQHLGEMAQSVVMKHSMVPMLGWIMPEPLAMPPRVTVCRRSLSTAISFFMVSVVMMAVAAASEPADRLSRPQSRACPFDDLHVDGPADDAGGGHHHVICPGPWPWRRTCARRTPAWGRRRWRCRSWR